MNFLFRQALALIGKIDAPETQKKLFHRFGGGDSLLSLYDKMRQTIEDDRLGAPDLFEEGAPDPNVVAGYLDHPEPKTRYQTLYEEACLDSDPLLAEAACSSIILNLYQEKATRAPKSCRQRLYAIASEGRADQASRRVSNTSAFQTASPRQSRDSFSAQCSEEDYNPFETRYRERSSEKSRKVSRSFSNSLNHLPKKPLAAEICASSAKRYSEPSHQEQERKNNQNDWFQNLFFILMIAGILYWLGPQILRQYKDGFFHHSPSSASALSDSSASENQSTQEKNPSVPLAAANPLTTQSENLSGAEKEDFDQENRPKRVLEGTSAHHGYFPAGQNPAVSLTIPEKNNNVFHR